MRPRGAPAYKVQIAYLVEVLCPQIAEIAYCRYSIPPRLWNELTEKQNCKSLRILAKEYGASYEAVRRVLKHKR